MHSLTHFSYLKYPADLTGRPLLSYSLSHSQSSTQCSEFHCPPQIYMMEFERRKEPLSLLSTTTTSLTDVNVCPLPLEKYEMRWNGLWSTLPLPRCSAPAAPLLFYSFTLILSNQVSLSLKTTVESNWVCVNLECLQKYNILCAKRIVGEEREKVRKKNYFIW